MKYFLSLVAAVLYALGGYTLFFIWSDIQLTFVVLCVVGGTLLVGQVAIILLLEDSPRPPAKPPVAPFDDDLVR